MNPHLVLRIFMPGGIIAHNDLAKILALSKKFNVTNIQFGLRQDINIMVDRSQQTAISAELDKLEFDYEFNTDWSRNIVTSYVSNGVFVSESWLTEGTYLDILDSFDYKPKLRINIVDPNQGLVPILTGNLNFIASKNNNYWYLKMELPNWFSDMTDWPSLVYSYDIAKVANKIEELYNSKQRFSLDDLSDTINELLHSNSRRVDQELKLPSIPLPYYEGVNKNGNKYWLGIYKRNYLFNIDFLEAVLDLLAQNNINKICITPWRSILIKGIKETEWSHWLRLLGKYGINIRHSSLELNWRVPDFDRSAIELKQYLVNEFDKNDIRTYGLTFAVRTKKVDLDAMIVIERLHSYSLFKENKLAENFNILHTKGFEENQKEYVLYAEKVNYKSLPRMLQNLTNQFYEEQVSSQEKTIKKVSPKKADHIIYQCKNCFTTYDQEFGDDSNHVKAGTPFKDISNSFKCPVCDAAKSDFIALETENSAA
jgi:rubredoxin